MSTKNTPKTPNKRRSTLRNLAITGGIVGTAGWSKPVVESVVLPAHAQISDPLRDPCFVTIIPNFQNVNQYFVVVSGHVEPPSGGITINIEATTGVGGQTFNESTSTAPDGEYSSSQLGPFDVCDNNSNVRVTVSSPSFADTAECFGIHQKGCQQ